MGEIGGNAGGVDNIVESKLVDVGRGLEEEGKGLEEVSMRIVVWRVSAHTWPMPPAAPATTRNTSVFCYRSSLESD